MHLAQKMKNRKEIGFSPDWANQKTPSDDSMCGQSKDGIPGKPQK